MVYKKYIKKDGKLFGPYYYESYRDSDGSVKTRYLENYNPSLETKKSSATRKFPFSLFSIFVFSILIISVFATAVYARDSDVVVSVVQFFSSVGSGILELGKEVISAVSSVFSGGFTGFVFLDADNKYKKGDFISGNLNIGLKDGELLPADTQIVITINNPQEFVLSDLVEMNANGNYFYNGTNISGSGSGYGFEGERGLAEDIYFTLVLADLVDDVLSSDSSEISEETEENTSSESSEIQESSLNESVPETESEIVTEEPLVDTSSEAVEQVVEEIQTTSEETPIESSSETSSSSESSSESSSAETLSDSSSESSESSDSSDESSESSSDSGSIMTGEVVLSEEGNIIYAFVNRNENLEYNTNKKLVEIKNVYSASENLTSSVLDVQETEGKIVVSTEYGSTEKGFGLDYLGSEEHTLTINLEDLKILAENGTLKIELIYNGQVLDETQKDIFVEDEQILIETNVSEPPIITKQHQAIIGKPVKWVTKVNASQITEVSLPKEAENISIVFGEKAKQAFDNAENSEEEIENIDRNTLFTGNAIKNKDKDKKVKPEKNIVETDSEKIVDIENIKKDTNEEQIAIEYETPAPIATEFNLTNGKQVTISAADELNYTNILAFTEIQEKTTNKGQIRVLWVNEGVFVNFEAYDLDGNGKLDYLEWIVPHLSNQTYEIIFISKAERLDENKIFIEDVYPLVSVLDESYSLINNGEYLRVTFERNLTQGKDITIYAKSSGNAQIEVYEKDSDVLLARFENVLEDKKYKIIFNQENLNQDSFDLKVLGNVEFDYVVDPSSFGDATIDAYSSSLKGVWKMEESSGTRNDFLGYTNLTPSGTVTQVAGKSGNAASIGTGGSALTKLSVSSDLKPTAGKFTQSYWINFNSLSAIEGWSDYISYFSDDDPEGMGYWPYDIGLDTVTEGNHFIKFDLMQSNEIPRTAGYSASFLTGTWYHLVIRANGAGEMSLWLNGSKVATQTYSNAIWIGNGPHRFAISPYNGDHSFIVDEVYYWNNESLSDAAIGALYNSGTGKFYSASEGGGDTTAPSVIFNSQIPADIDSSNSISPGTNITYNISDDNLNLSTIKIYYKVNSTNRDQIIFVNGTAVGGYQSIDYSSNISLTFNFILGDNDVYPAIYNYNARGLTKVVNTLTSANSYLAMQFLNITNTTQYNTFEIMSNSTSIQRFYYCNSSYNFVSSPLTNNNCIAIASLAANQLYNHTHSPTTSHQVIVLSVNTTDGTLGGKKITSTSWFLLRGNSGAGNQVYYYSIVNTTRQGAMRTTTNSGTTWTNQTFTTDSHVHQFSGASSIYYQVCANDTSNNQNCSSIRQDLYQLAGLSSQVFVYTPVGQVYSSYINITYSALSPNAYGIVNYTLELINSSGSLNQTLVSNTTNTSYYWDSTTVLDGIYSIRVSARDNMSQSGFSLSEEFTIDNSAPLINFTNPTPVNATSTTNTSIIINITSNENLSYCVLNITYLQAIGGNITYDGNYIIHTFNSSGTFNVTSNLNVEVLVVAGGGGGGTAHGGGGGAGGLIFQNVSLTSNSYSIVIGAGGAGGNYGVLNRGGNGENSSAFGLVAIGGGGGKGTTEGGEGFDGGSGGGASRAYSTVGHGFVGQGHDGGLGTDSGDYPGGGGGGAAENAKGTNGRDGGNGIQINISGILRYYAGGGGGGTEGGTAGTGGSGGGGAGSTTSSVVGTAGIINTGGGGGGGGRSPSFGNGGAGGSGVVVVRYKISDLYAMQINNAGSQTSANYTLNNLSLGNLSYFVSCNDTSGNANLTEIRLLQISSDTTLPNATIINPLNGTVTNNGTINFTINVSDAGGLANVTLYLYNQSGLYNQTTVALGGVTNSLVGIVVSLVDGIYNWFWTVVDLANNLFSTQNTTAGAQGNFTLTIDTTSPVVNLLAPTNNSIWNYSRIVNFTFNVSDVSSIGFCNLSVRNFTIPREISTSSLGLFSLYHLNQNWDDSLGIKNGTVNGGATFNITSYKLGNASGQFDGNGDYVSGMRGFNRNDGTTLNIWFKTTQGGYAFQQEYWDNSNTLFALLPQISDSNGYFYAWAYALNGGNRDDLNIQSSVDYRDNQWHMISIVLNGSSNIGYAYIDGNYLGSDSFNGPSSWTADQANSYKIIGGGRGYAYNGFTSWTGYFNGLLDEFSVYNRTLNLAEIQNLYNSQLATSYSNYSFNYSTNIANNTNNTLTLNLTNGNYEWNVNCSDILNNSAKTSNFNFSVNYLQLPIYSNFSSNLETTNFSAVADLTNVTNLTIASSYTKIQFPSNYGINVEGEDYDTNLLFGLGFISVNSSALDQTFNSSANVSLYGVDCNSPIYFNSGFLSSRFAIISQGNICNSTSNPACTNLICSARNATFIVSHFTGFAMGLSSNLTIWDETDSNMPFANFTKYANQSVLFFSNYSNSTNIILNDSNCIIYFTDTQGNMSFNATKQLFEFSRNFTTNGTFDWNVSCNNTIYTTLSANDSVLIDSTIADIIAPQLNFTNPTPANGTSISNTFTILNISTEEANLKNFTWNFGNSYLFNGFGSLLDNYNSNLTAVWKFESGFFENDSLGRNNLTNIGADLTSSGKSGTGAFLVRANSDTLRITSPGTDITGANAAFTISMWVNFTTIPNNNEMALFECNAASHYWGWLPRHPVSGQMRQSLYAETNSGDYTDTSTEIFLTPGQWYHFVFTAEIVGSNAVIKTYQNGTLTQTWTVAGTSLTSMSNFYLGSEVGSSRFLDGTMDEVYFWKNKALDSSDIASLYNSGAGKFYSQQSAVNTTSTALYDSSLMLMMNFDNRSSLGDNQTYAVDVARGNNGTLVNGVTSNVSGKYGGAMQFDGNNDFLATNADIITQSIISNGATFSAWVYPYSITNNEAHIVYLEGRLGLEESINDNNKWAFRLYDSSDHVAQSTTNIQTNQWVYLTGVWNTTNVLIYINGVLENSTSASNPPSIDAVSRSTTVGAFSVDKAGTSAANWFNGSIDEVRIYNRSLSAAEIQQQYKSNLAKFNLTHWEFISNQTNLTAGVNYSYSASACDTSNNCNSTETRLLQILPGDTTSPNGTIISPTNGTITNNTNINFTINVSDSGGLANVTLYLYNQSGLYNTTTVALGGVTTSLVGIVVSLVDGVYNWFWTVVDLANNLFSTQNSTAQGNYTITIDATKPLINFTNPTPINNTQTSNTSFIVNITSNENLSSCILSINSNYTYNQSDAVPNMTDYTTPSGNASASSNAYGIYPAWYAFDGRVSATYAWLGTLNEDNHWVQYDFGVGNTKKIIAFNLSRGYGSAYNATTYEGTKGFYINASNDESNWTTIYNGTFGGLEHYKIVFATNPNYYRYYRFFVYSHYTNGPGNWYDAFEEIDMWEANSSAFVNYTMQLNNNNGNTNANYSLTNLSVGNYSYYSWCNDTIGNANQTETRLIQILSQLPDTTSPLINFTNPTPINNTQTSNTGFIVNITSNENLSSCILSLSGESYQYNATDVVPNMTGFNTPQGNVTNSTYNSANYGWLVFDNNNVTYWVSGIDGYGWVAYQFVTPQRIVNYSIMFPNGQTEQQSPARWNFSAYNGSSWIVLDNHTSGQWTQGEKRYYSFSNNNYYSAYRLEGAPNQSNYRIVIAELEMFSASGGILNYTMQVNNNNGNTTASYNVSNLHLTNNYSYYVTCNDTFGNANQTETRLIQILDISAVYPSSDSGLDEWRMFGRYLNNTRYTNANGPENISATGMIRVKTGSYVYATPSVANGYVYFGSYDNKLYQVNASNVSKIIATYTTGNNFLQLAPTIAGDSVYIGNSDSFFYQLNASNISQLIAKYDTAGVIRSSALVVNGYVYFGSADNKLYQLNATNVSKFIASYTSGGDIWSSPSYWNGNIYFGSLSSATVYQLNASNVSQKIASYDTGTYHVASSPAVADGYVYVGAYSAGKIYQLNATNISKVVNTYDTAAAYVYGSPAVANGYVYICDSSGYLYQLNSTNISKLVNRFDGISNFYLGAPAVNDKYVYVVNDYAEKIYQLNATNVSKFIGAYSKSNYRSNLALAGGFIYFGSADTYLYQLGDAAPLEIPTYPLISFVSPTPTNNTPTINTSIVLKVNISASDLSSVVYNWNNTNYPCEVLSSFIEGNYSCTDYSNESLILAMNFDNDSAIGENSTYVVDLSSYGNDGTIYGNAFVNSSGKYNSAMQFDGSSGYVSVPNSNYFDFSTEDFTIGFWMKTSQTGSALPLKYGRQAGGYENYMWEMRINDVVPNKITFLATDGNGWDILISSTSNINTNNWTYVTVTRSSGLTNLYINSINESSTSNVCNIANLNYPLVIGSDINSGGSPVLFFNGLLDEFRIYNRSLTAEEIKQQYYSTIQKFNSTQWQFTTNQTSLSLGNYSYSVSACDLSGNCNSTEIRSLSILADVDTTAPFVNLLSPANNSIWNYSRIVNFTFNVSDASNLSSCNLSAFSISGTDDNYTKLLMHMNGANGSISFVDESGKTVTANGDAKISTNQFKFKQASGLFDGSDYLTVSNDFSDFEFGSDNFTIDWWAYATATSSFTFTRNPAETYSPFLIGPDSIYMTSVSGWDVASAKTMGGYSLNQWVHYAIVRAGNNFYTFKDGVQKDSWTSSLSIKASSSSLRVGGGRNGEGTHYIGYLDEVRVSKGIARWTANFTPPNTEYYIYYRNYSTNITNNANNTLTLNLSNGNYNWNVNCSDTSNNSALTSNFNLTVNVDTTSPVINFTNPTLTNNSATNVNYTTINVSVNSNVSSCILVWDPPVVGYYFSVSDGICPALVGNYTENGTANGYTQYSHISGNYHIIRMVGSNVWWVAPHTMIADGDLGGNGCYYRSTSPNGTFNSNGWGYCGCTQGWESSSATAIYGSETGKAIVNYTMQINNNGNLTTANYTVTGLQENINYSYYVWCNESSGNSNRTEDRALVLDLTLPNGTIISPANGTVTNNGTINFTINVSDNTGLANATIYIYNASGLYNTTTVALGGVTTSLVGIVVSLVDGVYNWFWTVVDLANNLFSTQNTTAGAQGNFTITIDSTGPVINLLTPANNSIWNYSRIVNFTFNASDSSNISSCNLSVYQAQVTGANISYDGNYIVYTFNSNGTFNARVNMNVEVLVVAGGGAGGGDVGGGGGAGGLIYNSSYLIVQGSYNVTVGIGGQTGSANGQNSTFGSLSARGGGGGGYFHYGGNSGGSGGGGTNAGGEAGGAGTAGQGYKGGDVFVGFFGSGGGGGASEPGHDAYTTSGGAGGNGTNFTINGTNVYYAGGGGGGGDGGWSYGGIGGGGNGAIRGSAGTNGVDGLGGGGGGNGGAATAAKGGRGVVIVRYLNNNFNNYSTNINNSQNTTLTLSIPNGNYNWNVNCSDTNNNSAATSNFNLTVNVDTTTPNGTIISPANGTITNNTNINFTINVSDNAGLANVTLYLYNQSGLYNQTTVSLGGVTTSLVGIVVTIVDGIYNWFWTVVDLANNLFSTQNTTAGAQGNFTITEDNTIPLINITYPISTNYTQIITRMNYTLAEINPSSCWFFNGTANNTMVCGNNITTNLYSNQGSNTWIVYANDSAGNQNSTRVTFFVDSIVPIINLISPANETQTTTTAQTFSYNVSDTNNIINCSLILNGNVSDTNNSIVKDTELNFSQTLVVGSYNWSVNCTDEYGNIGNSSERSLTISSPPVIGGGGGTTTTCTDSCSSLGYTCGSHTICGSSVTCGSCGVDSTCQSGQCVEIPCVEDWQCSSWNTCTSGEQSRNCNDLNSCGTQNSKPSESQSCSEILEIEQIIEDQQVELDTGCGHNWSCTEWSECDIQYSFEDLLNVQDLKGKQSRTCSEPSCSDDLVSQERECSLAIDVYSKETVWCGKNYIELYRKDSNELVSRIDDQRNTVIPSLNLNVLASSSDYCDYCYDGEKDYDEENIDCGGSCPVCTEEPTTYTTDKVVILEIASGLLALISSLAYIFGIYGTKYKSQVMFRPAFREDFSA